MKGVFKWSGVLGLMGFLVFICAALAAQLPPWEQALIDGVVIIVPLGALQILRARSSSGTRRQIRVSIGIVAGMVIGISVLAYLVRMALLR